MKHYILPYLFIIILPVLTIFGSKGKNPNLPTPSVDILVNQVGYNLNGYKDAVISADKKLYISSYKLVDAKNDSVVYQGKVTYIGTVGQWKNWKFWKLNFSNFSKPGKYFLQVNIKRKGYAHSYSFKIKKNILDISTLSNVIFYFKGMRSTGTFDQADRHLQVPGSNKTVDVHGGWYDAAGDYGIHFTQLTASSYFNTQQMPLVAWSLLKTYEELKSRNNPDFREYERRLITGGMYGADFLVRMHIPNHSFYTSIVSPFISTPPDTKEWAKDRHLAVEIPDSVLKHQSADNPLSKAELMQFKPSVASFRAGGGMAIAALALASTFNKSGDFSSRTYLHTAENAFNFLQKNGKKVTNDGKENIVDDYCALLAATDLYKASHKQVYMKAATKRAKSLVNRLTTWKKYKNYWRANNKKRPFFHPSDAGLPVVSLWEYYEIANTTMKKKVLQTVKKSMKFELAITSEVTNPFGYARELVQDTTGIRYSAFFFPHNAKTSKWGNGGTFGSWWQGENARIASLAAAGEMTALHFKQKDPKFYRKLEKYARNQLNWILGLNPFDICMLDGSGHSNPAYYENGRYKVFPGGIVNGITAAPNNPRGIAFGSTTQNDAWRWREQWLPHAAWYMLAVSVGH